MDFTELNFIINKFFNSTKILNIDFINSGLVNRTYLVEHLYNGINSKFILQCLNNIFEPYDRLNFNHELITNHFNKKINNNSFSSDWGRWEVPFLIKCQSNNRYIFTFESNSWRAIRYIDQTFTTDLLEDKIMAYQTGLGLAKFHLTCSDIEASKLNKSIENFHNTNYYINQYDIALEKYDFMKLDDKLMKRINYLIYSIDNHKKYAKFLFDSLKNRDIDQIVIHGDPKLSNFLFDVKRKFVVSLIDLDTVSKGYLLIDLADCIRSICNLTGEDTENIDKVYFDINSCMQFLIGYLSITSKKFDRNLSFLPEFIYLIIFELTIRFFTDFLQSNKYFTIKYPTQNLFRAEVQYRLLSSFLTNISHFTNELHGIGISSGSTFVSDVEKFA